jgi:hypothetical protein
VAKIEDLAKQLYGDNHELAEAIIADARERGTAERIESGELSLPAPLDAAVWYQERQAAQAKEAANRPPPQPRR